MPSVSSHEQVFTLLIKSTMDKIRLEKLYDLKSFIIL